MVEKIDTGQANIYNKTSVENLVQQLGIPLKNAQRWTKALYVAFGKEEQSTQRIIAFLTSKIQEKA